jgi:hypothetical protein
MRYKGEIVHYCGECPCAEPGLDGTINHVAGSKVILRHTGPENLIAVCVNHSYQYIDSPAPFVFVGFVLEGDK